MKTKELNKTREKKTEDLEVMAMEKRRELTNAYASKKASNESNLKVVKNIKRDLAQILTVIREKEIINEEKGNIKDNKNTK